MAIQFFNTVGIDEFIIHNGDTNTKFGFVANDTFAINTSGNERVRVTSGGNVGIGTASNVDERLHVQGSVNNDDIAIKIENTFDNNDPASEPTAALVFTAASNNGYMRLHGAPADTAAKHQLDIGSTAGSSYLTFSPSTTEKMRITSAGNVGVATTSPAAKFQVGDGTTNVSARVYYSDNTYTEMRGYGLECGRNTTYIRPTANNSKTLHIGFNTVIWSTLSLDATNTLFKTSGTEHMRITSSGNVGIGTTSPAQKLHVAGNVGIDESIIHNGDADTKIGFVANDNFAITTNGTERVRVTSGGSVGIATNNPGSKLDVEGNAKFGTANTAGTYAVAIGDGNSAGGQDSLAQGHLTDASGFAAAAFNYDTTASGGASAAFGALTTASGANSFAAGGNSTAGGVESAVFGTGNTIGSNAKASLSAGDSNTTNGPFNFTVGVSNGNNAGNVTDGFGGNIVGGKFNSITGSTTNGALAMGSSNTITASSSACFGGGNSVFASSTLAIGINNYTISGQSSFGANSILVGFQNNAQFGENSIVGGYQSDSFGENSIAYGLGATASTGDQQFAFGEGVTTPTGSTSANMSNQFVVGRYNAYSVGSTGHLFAVGSGSSNTSRSNALNVIGTGSYTTGQLSINSTTGYSSSTYFSKLHVNGYATKTTGSSWVSVSDERLKSNIEVYEKGLSEILQITPKTFEFNGKAGTQTGISHVGIVAQEIKNVLPESINVFTAKLEDTDETETELYDFNQDPLIYTLLNAVKELSAKIDTLENRIQTLEGN